MVAVASIKRVVGVSSFSLLQGSGMDGRSSLAAIVDKFNRRLYHCTWPHKSGGRNVLGDRGCQNNFAMSCILQNVFNSWFQANSFDLLSVDFSTNCLLLADEVDAFATTLVT